MLRGNALRHHDQQTEQQDPRCLDFLTEIRLALCGLHALFGHSQNLCHIRARACKSLGSEGFALSLLEALAALVPTATPG